MIEFESATIQIDNPTESFFPAKANSNDFAQKDDMKKIFVFDEVSQSEKKSIIKQKPQRNFSEHRVYPKYSNEPSTVPLNSLKNSVEQNRLEGPRNQFKFHKQEDVVGAKVSHKKSTAKKDNARAWKDDFKKQISKNLAKYQANQRSISSISSYQKYAKPVQATSIESEKDSHSKLKPKFEEAIGRNQEKFSGYDLAKMNRSYERQNDTKEVQKQVCEKYSKSQMDNQEPPVENIYEQMQFPRDLQFKEEAIREQKEIPVESGPQEQAHPEPLDSVQIDLIVDSDSKKNVYNVYNPERKDGDEEAENQETQTRAKAGPVKNVSPNPLKLSNSISFNENQFGSRLKKKVLLSEAATTEKAKEKTQDHFIDIFDLKEDKSREVETNAKASAENSIVSSIRSISRVDSTRNSARRQKGETRSGTKNAKLRQRKDQFSESRPPILNRSQQIPRVSDFLAEKEENTIRKSKKVRKKSTVSSQKNAKGSENQSRKNQVALGDKVLKMFLERQKEYRGRLENLEKKTDSSHRMLGDLWGLADSMKVGLDSLAHAEQPPQQLMLNLEAALDKFERLSTELKESQVLQKYWLDNLKLSSSKLETLVKKELSGQQSRCSEFFHPPQSVTSRTFQSYTDPLNSESNSLFQRKIVGQNTHNQPRRKQYSILGSQRLNRNYRKAATQRLSQENNQLGTDAQAEQLFQKLSTEHNALVSPSNFIRRKNVQTHQIQRGSSKDTRTKNSRETVNSRKQYAKPKRREEVPEKISRDTEETWKQVKDKRTRPKVRKEDVYFMSNRVQLNKEKSDTGPDAERELKKSQSNRLINKNLGQINIYHTSSKQKLVGALNNKSLPYLNAHHFADRNAQDAVPEELPQVHGGSHHSGVSIEFQMGSEKRGDAVRLGTPQQTRDFDKAPNVVSSRAEELQREDFVIESIRQSKKSLRQKKEAEDSREELIQLNHDFIKKEATRRPMPSQIVASEMSETESGYDAHPAHYETNSTVQSEERAKVRQVQKVVLGQPVSPMLNAWEPKIDYTQGRPVGNIIYNPHMMHAPQGNFHVYPPNHSLTPQFPFYNNSNLYQKAQMIPAYDSSYTQNFTPHQSVPVQSNFRPVAPKNKRKKKKKKRFNQMGHQKFNQLNKLNQKILKKQAKKKGGSRSGNYSEDFSQISGNHSSISGKMANVSSPMMSYANPPDHVRDAHYNSRYYYSKPDPSSHLNF